MSLNPEQRRAVDHRGSPLLVLAGAGTGKTRVITHRVAALLDENVPPWRILAVTFTNKAAAQMRDRIRDLCDDRHEVGKVWVGTFHSTCARILRKFGDAIGLSPRFSIYDTSDQASVMTRVLRDLNVSDRLFTPRGVLGYIDRAKNRGLGPEEVDQLDLVEPVRSVVRKAYEAYQARLLAADAVDFGDLIVHTVNLLRNAERGVARGGQLSGFDPVLRFARSFDHVVVDEFQDTNPVQAELVDRLSVDAELCVVGDDDQSIYGWRGADVDIILRFGDRHRGCETVRLEQNYRSTTNILNCADAVIRKNARRLGKTLWSELGEGEPVRLIRVETERDEARLVAREIANAIDEGENPEEFAVFYRTHAQSRVLEDELRRMSLSCRIVGGVAFYERAEIKDVISYLAVLRNPNSDAHLLRILNRPARGIGSTSQNKLVSHAASRTVSLWTALGDPEAAGLGRAAARKISAFRTMIEDLREGMAGASLDVLLERVLDATGYREALAADGDDDAVARLENLQELHGNVLEFVAEQPQASIDEYLELVSLVGAERAEGDRNAAVTLMTIHSAKGLEFEHVYLTGMEERVFPHARVLDDPRQLEEERRLAYVAVTRAKRCLTVTTAARRRIFGQVQVGVPSRFIMDFPPLAIVRVGAEPSLPSYAAPVVPRRPEVRRPSKWQDDIEYEVPPDEAFDLDVPELGEVGDGTPLYVGMTFRHKDFGDGELIGWSGAGGKLKLQLRFAAHGTKTVLARFVQAIG